MTLEEKVKKAELEKLLAEAEKAKMESKNMEFEYYFFRFFHFDLLRKLYNLAYLSAR
jgi:hypothetical protein